MILPAPVRRASRRLSPWLAGTVRVLSGAVAALVLVAAACKGSSGPSTPPVASVEVTPNAATRQVGETVQLGAAVKDAQGNIVPGQAVAWSSSVPTVASVSASGLVTALTIGVTSVSAAAGGRSGGAVITVVGPPVGSVTLSPTVDTLLVGETVQLDATVRTESGQVVTDRPVTWTTASAAIATVGATGLVTAVGDGTVLITATSEGKSAQASITVFGPCSTALAVVIEPGDMVQGTLASTDCRLDDNTYADGYFIQVTQDTPVQIDMTSTAFDTWLWLLELTLQGELEVVEFNDDVSQGVTDSRIVFTLKAGVEYFILANSFDPNVFGPYQLAVMAVAPDVSPRLPGVVKPGRAPAHVVLRAIRPPR